MTGDQLLWTKGFASPRIFPDRILRTRGDSRKKSFTKGEGRRYFHLQHPIDLACGNIILGENFVKNGDNIPIARWTHMTRRYRSPQWCPRIPCAEAEFSGGFSVRQLYPPRKSEANERTPRPSRRFNWKCYRGAALEVFEVGAQLFRAGFAAHP